MKNYKKIKRLIVKAGIVCFVCGISFDLTTTSGLSMACYLLSALSVVAWVTADDSEERQDNELTYKNK
ncbi:MAG: hypothetical protein Q4A56_03525 [Porphyromonadaceae bacterium]|nr:hypothetical protein [Porphyromonadaceae bacterium]